LTFSLLQYEVGFYSSDLISFIYFKLSYLKIISSNFEEKKSSASTSTPFDINSSTPSFDLFSTAI